MPLVAREAGLLVRGHRLSPLNGGRPLLGGVGHGAEGEVAGGRLHDGRGAELEVVWEGLA